jgi:hypothetical protein
MKEKSEKIVATFLIASDHNLPEVYCVYVIESVNHLPVLSFGSLKSMHTEKFHLPYPFSRPTPSPVVVPRPGESSIKVTSCIESENEFKLKIIFDCHQNVSGKLFGFIPKLRVKISFSFDFRTNTFHRPIGTLPVCPSSDSLSKPAF